MAFSFGNLGAVATCQGDYGRATMLHQESLALGGPSETSAASLSRSSI
jgi:hypothetical protein